MNQHPAVVFPIARRRMRRRALIRLLIGLALVALGLYDLAGQAAGETGVRLWLLPLLAGPYLAAQGLLRLLASRRAEVRLTDEAIEFPPGIALLRSQAVPYGDIELLVAQARGGSGRVVVGTRARVHVVDALDIGGLMTLKAFHEALRLRIATSAAGPAHLERIDRGLELTRRLMLRRARVTEIILVLLGIAYLGEIALDAVDPFSLVAVDALRMVQLGAIVPALVLDEGQWFRLVSGTMLHAGLLHIYLNGMAILALGGLMERLIGGYRLAAIYILSAFAGSLASVFVSTGWLSVGASGAVFGLLGAFGVLQLRHGGRLPPGIGQSRRWWLVILGLNAALPIALPMIDVWAHVGGFVGGAAAAGLLLRQPDAIRPDRPPPFVVQAVAMALIGLATAGLALGVDHARTADGPGEETYRKLLERTDDAQALNALAWGLVIAPDTPEDGLRFALAAADRGLDLAPDDHHIRDTRATALYRLGRHREAIAEERRVLAAEPTPYYATQLLRFVRAAQAAGQGTPVGSLAAEAPTILGEGWPAPTLDGETLRWTPPSEAAPPPTLSLYAAVEVGGEPVGFVRARSMRGEDGVYSAPAVDAERPPTGARLVPLLLDAEAADAAPVDAGWRVWPLDPEPLQLP